MNPIAVKVAPWVLVATMAGGIRACDVYRQRQIGAAKLTIRQTEDERDALRQRLDSLGRAAVAQVETLRVAVVRRVSVRDTVERWLRDTVPVPVEVVREIVRADSQVIQACTVALNTCEQEKLALRTDNQLLATQRDAYRVLIPSGFQKVRTTLRDVGIGVLLKIGYDALTKPKNP